MTHIEFILLYYDAVYQIVDGKPELIGKKTKIQSIDIPTQSITSVGGIIFPINVLRAELRSIEDITDEQAIYFFKTYWGGYKMMRGDTNTVVEASKETFMHIIKGAWYISGDFEEMNRLLHTMRRYHIDVDNAKELGYVI